MNERMLRALVREAIARQLDGNAPNDPNVPTRPTASLSFALLAVPDGEASNGPCIIEPSVMCNHCGYCKSYGH